MKRHDSTIEEALVYLKLRGHKCNQSAALSFARRRLSVNGSTDTTIKRDGPPSCRKLFPLPTFQPANTRNGWLKGEKLKYRGAVGYSQAIQASESEAKRSITAYNTKSRAVQNQERMLRSQSGLNVAGDGGLEKIGGIRESVMRERDNRILTLELNGVKLDQTTKEVLREVGKMDVRGLVLKIGAFPNVLASKQQPTHLYSVRLTMDSVQMKGKSLSQAEIQGHTKRQRLLDYRTQLKRGRVEGEGGNISESINLREPNNLRESINLREPNNLGDTSTDGKTQNWFQESMERAIRMEIKRGWALQGQ